MSGKLLRPKASAGAFRELGRFGWGIGDQAVCSLMTFLVQVMVARTVSNEAFGAFSIAFSAYIILISVTRAISSDPMMVRFAAADETDRREAAKDVTGTAFTVGCAFLIVSLVVAPRFSESTSTVLVALGSVMPFLLLQDAWRFVFICAGATHRALINDCVWLLCAPPMLIFAQHVRPSPEGFVLAWGSSAAIPAIVGSFQARTMPTVQGVGRWLRRHSDLALRYFGESVLLTASIQAYAILIGFFASLAAVGQIRLVTVIMGPINILTMGITAIAVPEAARALRENTTKLDRVLTSVALALALGAAAWAAAVWILPTNWTSWIVGGSWPEASFLVLPLAISYVLAGLAMGPFVGLRVLEAAGTSLRIRIASSSLYAGSSVFAVWFGVSGAAWALVGQSLVAFVLWSGGYVARRPTLVGGSGESLAALGGELAHESRQGDENG